MPLTLECNCGLDEDVVICQITDVKLVVFADYEQLGPVGYGAVVWLTTNPTGTSEDMLASLFDPTDGAHYVDLPLEFLAPEYWNSAILYFGVGSSLFQPPSSEPAVWSIGYSIQTHYVCTNLSTGSIVKERYKHHAAAAENPCECFDIIQRTKMTSGSTEWIDEDGDVNHKTGVVSLSFTSSPLAAICNGCTSTFPGLLPEPKLSYILVDGSGQICLCASGGSGNYYFFKRSGVLPPGMSVDPDTGCLVGDATGPGSGQVEFGVLDLDTGEEAYATCNFSKACEGLTTPSYGNRMF